MLLKSFKNTKWEFHLSEKCRRLKTVSFIMNEPAKKSFQSFCPNVWLPWHCTRNEVLIKDFFSKCDQIRRKLDLVTFTEEIFQQKTSHFAHCYRLLIIASDAKYFNKAPIFDFWKNPSFKDKSMYNPGWFDTFWISIITI